MIAIFSNFVVGITSNWSSKYERASIRRTCSKKFRVTCSKKFRVTFSSIQTDEPYKNSITFIV
jgi:hypothetical protein